MDTASGKSLHEIIAAKIAAEIESGTASVLPPLNDLCLKYHVSKPTMVAATKLLRQRGILEYHPGQRMRIAGREFSQDSSSDTIFLEMRNQITCGTLRIGDCLPKVGYLAGRHHVSNHTVLDAYSRLTQDNLVHRSGKSWTVGPQRKRTSPVPVDPPILLLLQFREHSWGALGKADRTEKFCKTFEHEADQHYVQLVPALAEEGSFFHGYSAAEGHMQVRKYIKSIERQYLGTLIVGTRREIPDLPAWIEDLSQWRKPVVWFDRNDEDCTEHASQKYLTRCHFAEKPAEEAIMDLLSETGHQMAGYTTFYNDPWIHDRCIRLHEYGNSLPRKIDVTATDALSELIERSSDESLAHLLRLIDKPSVPVHDIFETVSSTFPQKPSELDDYGVHTKWGDRYERFICLLRLLVRLLPEHKDDLLKRKYGLPEYENGIFFQCPLLASILTKQPITALIAPNDSIARYVYIGVRALGMSVPDDISIVSFDNYWLLHHLPVTTVDFGFGNLGYTAFHSILGDIPVSRPRDGSIASRPWIVHRGSVAPPSRRRLAFLAGPRDCRD